MARRSARSWSCTLPWPASADAGDQTIAPPKATPDLTNRRRVSEGSFNRGSSLGPLSGSSATPSVYALFAARVNARVRERELANALRLRFACARLMVMAVAAVPTTSLLDEIQQAFELSNVELGRLFGVSRQAVGEWRLRGVPGSRQEKAATVAAIADLLVHSLKPQRIPGVARRPAPAYGGLTMLEMIARGRHRELLDLVRGSFDWASSA